MSCKIIRNTENKIIKVLDPITGKESKIFKNIAILPHVKSLEEAVTIYDEVLKTNLKSKPVFDKNIDDEFITISNYTGKVNLSEVQTDFEFEGVLSEEEIENLDIDDMLFKIDSIEVKEDKRGQGNAIKLMNEAISEFKDKGFDQIVLNASPMGFGGLQLEDLTGFYEKFGFKTVADQGNNRMMLASKESIKKVIKDSKPIISIVSNDVVYESFKEALEKTEANTIELVSNGTVVASFPSTVDERTTEGVINALIVDGVINSNKVVFNGKTYFQTAGKTFQDRKITAEFFKDTIKGVLSKGDYKVTEDLIEIFDNKIEPSEENSLHRTISDTILDYFSSETVISKKNKINEENLKLNLMTILSDMGVSVLSLKQYQDKFKKKSQNTPPSAEALADIANRVIAFKEGQLNLENLTEEVMHFIVETLPKEQLEELSELVRNSQEYQDFYEKYNEVYKGDQKLLEKEILGKILKNITLNKIENKSFMSKLIDLIDNFFKNLKLTQQHRDQLKQLNSLVEKFVVQQNGESFTEDDLSKSKEIALMYSLSSTVSNATSTFKGVFDSITDYPQLNSYTRELKNTSFENLRGKALEVAVSRFVEMSDRLIDTTKDALKTAKKIEKGLSGQNKAILENLDSEIRKTLSSIAEELKNPQEGILDISRNILKERLQENAKEINALVAENGRVSDDGIKKMALKVGKHMGKLENEVFMDSLEKALAGEVKDINQLFSFFGQLHHASNPILNLIAVKIWEMNMKTNQGTKEDVSDYLNYLKKNPSIKDRIQELFDHDKGFMKSKIDNSSFEAAMTIQKMDAFSEVTEKNFEQSKINISKKYNVSTLVKELNLSEKIVLKKLKQLETYKEELGEGNLVMSDTQRGKYQTLVKEKQLPLQETVMNEEYYKDLFEKYKTLNISGATQAYLGENSSQRGAIKANATKNGRIVLSPSENDHLGQISKIRKSKKSIFSTTSLLKEGLKISLVPTEDSIILPTGQYLSIETDDSFDNLTETEKSIANISFDLHKLDNDYMEKIKKEELQPNNTTGIAKQNFANYINSLEETHSEQEILDIIMSNLDISLSQDFYDTLNGDSFLKGNVLNKLNPDKKIQVEALKELYAKRNSILSIHRNSSSPFEIDKLSKTEQKYIRGLSIDISNGLKNLNLPQNETQENTEGEKNPNESYRQELKDQGIIENTEEEVRFILENGHANSSQLNRIENIFNKVENGLILSTSDMKLLNKYNGETLLQTKLNYLKGNLHQYYTRFTPLNYKSINNKLENGEDIVDILGSLFNNKYINVRIDNSFEEKDNPLKNPNYNDNYIGGFQQPKKGRFLDKDFDNKFKLDKENNPTKNKELFKARELYLNTRKVGLDKMNEKGYNPYRIIQISATGTEKGGKVLFSKNKRSTLKEIWRDTFSYRIDDLAYGEKDFSSSKKLPKYYTRDLENQEDVSTDYSFALVQATSRANEYAEKKNIISDIDSLQDNLMRSHSRSKNLKNTINIVNSFIDNNIYGKIESKPFAIKVPGRDTPLDVTKVVRVITKFTSLRNLGFNVIIPITSFLTAGIQKKVTEFVGDKLNKDAANMADKEYIKLMKEAGKNALDFNDNSKLYLIGQAFGIYDISSKARNAKYNTFQRTFSKTAMGAHSIANFPITPRIALSIMFDNRIVNNKIQTRQQFLQEGQREGKTKDELLVTWRTLEENTIYKYMDFTETGFKWKTNTEKETNLSLDYLNERKDFLNRSIGERVSDIEGQIPQGFKIQAQRHALLSTTLLHRSFLAVVGSNRLRDRHTNVATGLQDEGTWRTASNVLGEFFNTKGNFGEKIQGLKDSLKPPNKNSEEFIIDGAFNQKKYNSAILDYELKVRNMKRVGIEMGSYLSLALIISTAMLLLDDDEDESYFSAVSNLLMMRTLNESATNLSLNVIGDIGGIIDDPIVIYDSAKKLSKVWQAFDFRDIENGKYKGLNKNTRYMMNIVPGMKSMFDLSSAKTLNDTRKVYENYQKNAILNISTFGVLPTFDYIKDIN